MNKHTLQGFVMATLAALSFTPGVARATTYDGLVAFGDSLSDNGNLFALTHGLEPAPPYWEGRFSNGPTAVENMAAQLHLGLQDYAYGGAQTGTGNVGGPLLNGTGVAGQVGMFSSAHGGVADSHSLYFVWAGPNDFLAGTNMFNPGTAPAAVSNLVGDISSLYALGARDFFVPLMPDLSVTPLAHGQGTTFMTAANQQSVLFDGLLSSAMGTFESTHGGAQVTVFDTLTLLDKTISQLSAQGVNTTDPCYDKSTSTVCANPNNYLFWDDLHPTELGHGLVGTAFAQAVPEPASLALMLGGLGALGVWTRRRGPAR